MTDLKFDRESTLALLSFNESLPSLPDFFLKIQEIAQDPDSSADDLAAVVRGDHATTAMLLKFANSLVYNPLQTPIGELSKAIARLGMKETIHIATAISLLSGISIPAGLAHVRNFWSHAFAMGMICEKMAKGADPQQKLCSHERAFMTGLLHDIGRAALSMRIDLAYFDRLDSQKNKQDLLEFEQDLYGVNHAEAGRIMLALWLFPADICAAVGEHHSVHSPSYLGRLCYQANSYCEEYLPDELSFDLVTEKVMETIKEHPFDLSMVTAGDK
ncbi:MAG: HDOD domain-containing protein [Mariprofundus sp.]|nr:HDOD domain-containing protein [Mariprofundus sp.]